MITPLQRPRLNGQWQDNGEPPHVSFVVRFPHHCTMKFINTASGSLFSVGNGLQSSQATVRCTPPFSLGDRQVVLVDTPGFDDTTRGDSAILAAVSTFLAGL